MAKTSKQLVLDLINADNSGLNLPEAAVTFANPATETGAHNTSCVLTAVADSGYTGTVTIHYDRVDLQDVVDQGPANGNTVIIGGAWASTQDVLAAINAVYHTNLEAGDIVVEALPAADGNGVINFNLKANANSFAFIGQAAFILKPADIDLATAVATTSLNGLTVGDVTSN